MSLLNGVFSLPSISKKKSSTRREERLLDEDTLRRVWILRKLMQPMEDAQATEFLLERLKDSKPMMNFFEQMVKKISKLKLSLWFRYAHTLTYFLFSSLNCHFKKICVRIFQHQSLTAIYCHLLKVAKVKKNNILLHFY